MKNRTAILSAVVLSIATFGFATSKSSAWVRPQTPNKPELILTVAPAIPPLAVQARISSSVVIELQINSSGAVNSAQFIEGHPLLRRTALDACLQWRFSSSPATLQTIRVTLVYPKLSWEEPTRVLILPYRIELQASLEPPPDTVSYVPEGFEAGKDRCEVHGTALEVDKVRIVYGLTVSRASYSKAERQYFPHANKVAYGGCVITDESPKYAEVLYCRRCREEEAKWIRRHRNEKRYSTVGGLC